MRFRKTAAAADARCCQAASRSRSKPVSAGHVSDASEIRREVTWCTAVEWAVSHADGDFETDSFRYLQLSYRHRSSEHFHKAIDAWTLPDRYHRVSLLILSTFRTLHGRLAFIYRDCIKFQRKLFDINVSIFEYRVFVWRIRRSLDNTSAATLVHASSRVESTTAMQSMQARPRQSPIPAGFRAEPRSQIYFGRIKSL